MSQLCNQVCSQLCSRRGHPRACCSRSGVLQGTARPRARSFSPVRTRSREDKGWSTTGVWGVALSNEEAFDFPCCIEASGVPPFPFWRFHCSSANLEAWVRRVEWVRRERREMRFFVVQWALVEFLKRETESRCEGNEWRLRSRKAFLTVHEPGILPAVRDDLTAASTAAGISFVCLARLAENG